MKERLNVESREKNLWFPRRSFYCVSPDCRGLTHQGRSATLDVLWAASIRDGSSTRLEPQHNPVGQRGRIRSRGSRLPPKTGNNWLLARVDARSRDSDIVTGNTECFSLVKSSEMPDTFPIAISIT